MYCTICSENSTLGETSLFPLAGEGPNVMFNIVYIIKIIIMTANIDGRYRPLIFIMMYYHRPD